MHLLAEMETSTSDKKEFRPEPSWQLLIQRQITDAMVDGASEVTLDLLHYIRDRMFHTPPSKRCIIRLNQFQAYEAKRYGIPPSVCESTWHTLDWRHAIVSSVA